MTEDHIELYLSQFFDTGIKIRDLDNSGFRKVYSGFNLKNATKRAFSVNFGLSEFAN